MIMLETVALPLTDTTVVITSCNLLLTGFGVEIGESCLDVVCGLFVVPEGVKAVWDIGAEVAAFSGNDDGSVAAAEFVATSGVVLAKSEAAEEGGESVKDLAADVGDAAEVSVGVEVGDGCGVELVEAPLGLRLTCR